MFTFRRSFIGTVSKSLKHYNSYNCVKRAPKFHPSCSNIRVCQSFNKLGPSITIFAANVHTSRTNRALPPLFWAVARPLLKVVAILFGRGIRKWWQSLPKNKRKYFLEWLIAKKYTIIGSWVVLNCGSFAYYYCHLEEHPMTKRKRFIIFSTDQILQLTNLQILMELENHKPNILPITHPSYKRVQRVASQLLNGNKDIPEISEKDWAVTVVDSDMIDAFVFLNGHIFVYTGILEKCHNDHQLGVVLGHEMAHAILGHIGEKLSNAHIAEMFLIIPLVLLWSVFPDAAALIFQLATSYFIKLIVELPYSRSIEMEADLIGLQLAAKSCFDVRQATVFWQLMSESDPVNNICEFISSHPSHEHRKQILEQLITPALELRKMCKCPDLH